MNHSRKESTTLPKTHEKSEILSAQTALESDESKGRAIAGFPWQFAMIVAVIFLGILIVILKGSGIV
jgi:hypothetical protein